MESSIAIVVGQRLMHLHKLRNFSRRDLATAIDASPAEIDEYESGARIPADRLLRISRALRVTIGALFTTSNQTPPKTTTPSAATSSEGVELMTRFLRISDPKLRKVVVEIADYLASAECDPPNETPGARS